MDKGWRGILPLVISNKSEDYNARVCSDHPSTRLSIISYDELLTDIHYDYLPLCVLPISNISAIECALATRFIQAIICGFKDC